jgi:hypothetical protein
MGFDAGAAVNGDLGGPGLALLWGCPVFFPWEAGLGLWLVPDGSWIKLNATVERL